MSRIVELPSRPRARAKKHRRGEALYRRAPSVVCYWQGNSLVFENYLTRRRIAADSQTCTILDFFGRWRSSREFFSYLKDYRTRSLRKALSLLVRHTFLQRAEGKSNAGEAALQRWGKWNPAAGFFHLSTKDVVFEPDSEVESRDVRKLARAHPLPRPFKRYPKAAHVPLACPTLKGEFPRVLLARRTWRRFSRRPVDRSALEAVLALTWGIYGWAKVPYLGSVALKTSPSGGALHPIEAYVLVRKVKGLRSGLYHYNGAEHGLDVLRRGATSRQIVRYLAGQWWYGGASFVVFMTAVFGRTQWKYDYARAYRAVLMEAGHLCQTFCLTATWQGLAPFCTIAFEDSVIERALDLDGISESVLYAVGAGTRPRSGKNAHLRGQPAKGKGQRGPFQQVESLYT